MSFHDQFFSVKDKIIVFTGGTGVLGATLSKGLAEAGASVAILGRRLDVAQKIALDIKNKGGKSIAIAVDVLDRHQLMEAKANIIDEYGRIDVLVNGAGGNLPGATVANDKSFFDLDENEFKKVIELNLMGTVLPSQVFGEEMAKNKQGVIVNISSMTSIRPLTRVVGYSAAKAAVSNFTQWLAVEMANKYGEGIRVNAIAPGFFLTEQNKTLLTNSDGSLTERGDSIIRNTPFKRFGSSEDLTGTLIWLCSDASKFVTGIVVPVDGGFSAFAGV